MTSPAEQAGSGGWLAPPRLATPAFPPGNQRPYDQSPTPCSAATPRTFREPPDDWVPSLYAEPGTTPTVPEAYEAPVPPHQVLGGPAPIDVDQIPAPGEGPGQFFEVPEPDQIFAPATEARDDPTPTTYGMRLLGRLGAWAGARRGGTTGSSGRSS